LKRKVADGSHIQLSPWHDLPLRPTAGPSGEKADLDIYTGVIEIERGTTAKMEVETKQVRTPIVQDKKKDKVTG